MEEELRRSADLLGVPTTLMDAQGGGYVYDWPLTTARQEILRQMEASSRQRFIDDCHAFGDAMEAAQQLLAEDPALFCAWFEENSVALTGMDLRKP